MAGIDESRQFIALKIAVLTVSDTRDLADDKSGATLVERIEKSGHAVAARAIVSDDVEKIRARIKGWIADPAIDVIITTGGTGFTGRDVTPEAVEPLFEKRMDGFATLFLMVSHAKIGTSAIQTRATAGVAGATYIFCLPGSPGACRDAWDDILVHQLDYRYRPCNFVEIMPRLDEHLRRAKAQGRDGLIDAHRCWCYSSSSFQVSPTSVLPKSSCLFGVDEPEAGPLVDAAGGGEHAVGPQRDLAVARLARKAQGIPRPAARRCRARARSARPEGGAAARPRRFPSPERPSRHSHRPVRRSSSARAWGRDCERRPRRFPPSALRAVRPSRIPRHKARHGG